MVTKAVHFSECKDLWSTSSRAPQYTQFAIDITRSVLRRKTKLHQGNQDPLQSSSRTTGISLNIFSNQLGWVYAWSGFCMGTGEDTSISFFAKIKFLEMSSEGFFRLLPTESLTASTLSGHLAVNFLSDLGSSSFLLGLLTDPVTRNLCTQR